MTRLVIQQFAGKGPLLLLPQNKACFSSPSFLEFFPFVLKDFLVIIMNISEIASSSFEGNGFFTAKLLAHYGKLEKKTKLA